MNDLIPRKEDYFVLATIFGQGLREEKVPCKIYLPTDLVDTPKLLLKPSLQQWERISRTFELRLEAAVNRNGVENTIKINVPRMYSFESKSSSWGDELWDSHVSCEALGLQIVSVLGLGQRDEKINFTFFLTPNAALLPHKIVEQSYTGDVKVTPVRDISVEVSPHFNFKFETHYSHESLGGGESRSIRRLVAVSQIDRVEDQDVLATRVLRELDDLLLLASFGTRRQVVCTNWEASDGARFYKSYRHGDVGMPKEAGDNFDDPLIDTFNFQKFLISSFLEFKKIEQPEALRLAIFSLGPFRKRNIEDGFMGLFSTLEKLLLNYRCRNNLTSIVNDADWRGMRGSLEQSIREFKPAIDGQGRALLYENLSGLNRVSLSAVYEMYIKDLGVYVDDLWPVFSGRTGISLYKIRNHLTHGKPLDHAAYEGVVVAKMHLAWVIERICLRLLNWPTDASGVSVASLSDVGHFAIRKRDIAQQRLTTLLAG